MASPPWTNAWDEAKPADNDLASSIGTQTRQFKLDVRQRLAYQHVWNKDVNTDGAHINLILSDADTIANKELLRGGGYSLTGANAQAMVELSGTWNTSGVPTLCRYNVNLTAVGAGALLVDRQVSGVSKYKVDKDGNATFAGTVTASAVTGAAVRQVTYRSTATDTTLSTSFADVTNLSQNITLLNAASRVKVRACVNVAMAAGVAGWTGQIDLQVFRDTTLIQEFDGVLFRTDAATNGGTAAQVIVETLDATPGGVGPFTYKVKGRYSGTPSSAHVNWSALGTVGSTITIEEII
jgi:hypothetical protein